jgi:hypothetical protein
MFRNKLEKRAARRISPVSASNITELRNISDSVDEEME